MPHITRRDFLNGVALTVASGLTPAAQLAAVPLRYPPALTGLRGHHDGSFEAAHRMRDGETPPLDDLAIEERYDLVVVGAGISGLSAAWFYRKRNPQARILILDNHDDFGGHAKRNEFTIDRRLLLSYGGSESLQSPKALYSGVAKGLLKDLGVDIARFETAFERKLYPSLGLSRGVFFSREAFGRDVLVTGDPASMVADDLTPDLLNAKPLKDFIAGFPLSDADKAKLLSLYDTRLDPLPGKSAEEKIAILDKTSYRDYLVKVCGCSERIANCWHGRSLDFTALASDLIPASFAREMGFPGFAGLGLPEESSPERDEPYIYHFPDGNASLARLLVRALIPGVASGKTMEDIVLARFSYDRLDRADQKVRVRLDSTCVNVKNMGDAVSLVYLRDGKAHRVQARHAVLACFNMAIPYMMPELPEAQRNALLRNVKAPLVYTKVLIRDWQAFAKLGVHEISAPMSFHCRIKLDYPVSLGGYKHPRKPSEPMCLHMVHVPNESNPGMEARDMFRIGRMKLLDMTFADFEKHIRDDLERILGPGGFSSRRDIAAITVNRWSHGYSYGANSLFDEDDHEATVRKARKPFGRVAIANSDSDWHAYAHTAIDQAERAVREVMEPRVTSP
ncbi:MAG: NAD(P)-binding protein [Pseudorhodoplanes sp.]|jgi:spermidine dehydrogenase|nr:NAD(P)-binding protein [Pseudorhodoplanes sp.]